MVKRQAGGQPGSPDDRSLGDGPAAYPSSEGEGGGLGMVDSASVSVPPGGPLACRSVEAEACSHLGRPLRACRPVGQVELAHDVVERQRPAPRSRRADACPCGHRPRPASRPRVTGAHRGWPLPRAPRQRCERGRRSTCEAPDTSRVAPGPGSTTLLPPSVPGVDVPPRAKRRAKVHGSALATMSVARRARRQPRALRATPSPSRVPRPVFASAGPLGVAQPLPG